MNTVENYKNYVSYLLDVAYKLQKENKNFIKLFDILFGNGYNSFFNEFCREFEDFHWTCPNEGTEVYSFSFLFAADKFLNNYNENHIMTFNEFVGDNKCIFKEN